VPRTRQAALESVRKHARNGPKHSEYAESCDDLEMRLDQGQAPDHEEHRDLGEADGKNVQYYEAVRRLKYLRLEICKKKKKRPQRDNILRAAKKKIQVEKVGYLFRSKYLRLIKQPPSSSQTGSRANGDRYRTSNQEHL
jgi:hypothetical protein